MLLGLDITASPAVHRLSHMETKRDLPAWRRGVTGPIELSPLFYASVTRRWAGAFYLQLGYEDSAAFHARRPTFFSSATVPAKPRNK